MRRLLHFPKAKSSQRRFLSRLRLPLLRLLTNKQQDQTRSYVANQETSKGKKIHIQKGYVIANAGALAGRSNPLVVKRNTILRHEEIASFIQSDELAKTSYFNFFTFLFSC
jgi:hypothetical protein